VTPSLAVTVRAFLRRDWRVSLTYRLPYLFDGLAVLASVVLFYYLAHYVRGSDADEFFAFVVAGLAVLRVNAALVHIVQGTEVEIAEGSMSYLLSSRLRPIAVMVGSAAFPLVRAYVFALCLVGIAIGIAGSGMDLNPTGVCAVVAGLTGAIVVFLGLAAGTTGAYLILRLGSGLSGLVTISLPILAGAYFPVSELPQPLRAVASALPFDDAVEVVRRGLLDGDLEVHSLAGLVTGLAVILPLGFALLHLGVRYSRRAGTLETP
jgi:ABC-type polysaccharide/polyol phosphate export permease